MNAKATESAQGYLPDPRNDGVLVYVNGEFVPRHEARVSIFDSGFVLGDGIWEGLRLVKGRIISLDAHLDRLLEGARSIALDIGMSRDEIDEADPATLASNGMTDGAHIRLMVTRGVKRTPNQDPRFVIGTATVVIVAEYKTPKPESRAKGLSLFTSTFRTSGPDVFDLRLNSHSRLNLIQALIQAIHAGADEALMLDPRGFVASCNSTNFFIVRRRAVDLDGPIRFKGITQRNVIDAWRAAGHRARMRLHAGPGVFGRRGLRHRHARWRDAGDRIDGRVIGGGTPGAQTKRAGELYLRAVAGRLSRAAGPAIMEPFPVDAAPVRTDAAHSRTSMNFDFHNPYPTRAAAGLRAQRRVHLASAGRAGRPAHDVEGRQRGGCRHRRRRRHDHLRAGEQRPGQRCLRHPLGRQELQGLNSSGPAPAAWTVEHFQRKYGADAKTPPKRGFDAVTVPGAVASWVALSERFGKLPFADLLEPAIDIAERGYLLPIVVQQKWAAATPELRQHAGLRAIVPALGPGAERGRAVPVQGCGARAARHRRHQGQARSTAARSRRRSRSSRPATAAASRRATSPPSSPSGSSRWRKNYRGYTLHEIPPNGQGIAALIALGILENFDLAGAAGRRRRCAAPADRGDEAGLRRRLPLRVRAGAAWK